MRGDFGLLIKSTVRIYKDSVRESYQGIFRNWELVVLQLLFVPACYLAMFFAAPLGGLVGGILLSFFISFLVSCYLVAISAAVSGGSSKFNFEEFKSDALALWGPVIGVFFALFLIQWVGDLFFMGKALWLKIAISLLVAILFNVLPELLYQRTSASMQMLADSFEFIKENFVEWLIPHALVVGFVYLVFPAFGSALGIMLVMGNPLILIRGVLSLLNQIGFVYGLFLVFPLCLLYSFFVFRGVLFAKLSSSSRRQRIYKERGL